MELECRSEFSKDDEVISMVFHWGSNFDFFNRIGPTFPQYCADDGPGCHPDCGAQSSAPFQFVTGHRASTVISLLLSTKTERCGASVGPARVCVFGWRKWRLSLLVSAGPSSGGQCRFPTGLSIGGPSITYATRILVDPRNDTLEHSRCSRFC